MYCSRLRQIVEEDVPDSSVFTASLRSIQSLPVVSEVGEDPVLTLEDEEEENEPEQTAEQVIESLSSRFKPENGVPLFEVLSSECWRAGNAMRGRSDTHSLACQTDTDITRGLLCLMYMSCLWGRTIGRWMARWIS